MKNTAFLAVEENGDLFGGKKGTQVAYRKKNYLTSAMTNAKVDKDKFSLVKITFGEDVRDAKLEVIEK